MEANLQEKVTILKNNYGSITESICSIWKSGREINELSKWEYSHGCTERGLNGL